jgi:hypothetical protein
MVACDGHRHLVIVAKLTPGIDQSAQCIGDKKILRRAVAVNPTTATTTATETSTHFFMRLLSP